MLHDDVYLWLCQGIRRQQVLVALRQPLTTKQLALGLELSLKRCSAIVWELRIYGLVNCLNPRAQRSRVYGLTPRGRACQRRWYGEHHLQPADYELPAMDWNLYGWVCHAHRSAVIVALDQPRQPCVIKRQARFLNPAIRMSANNVRDVIYLFLRRGIVKVVEIKGHHHPCYELTRDGRQMQLLLFRARQKHDVVSEYPGGTSTRNSKELQRA